MTMLVLATVLGVLGVGSAGAADNSGVTVTMVDPQKFTDVSLRCFGDKDSAGLLAEIETFLRTTGQAYVPEGGALGIKITNIDMAGEFEQWRGPQFCQTRIVLDVYAPRIDLEFRLTDATGAVLRGGTRHLTDLTYLSRPGRATTDRLRHEKGLLQDWLQKDLGDLRGSSAAAR
jgi:hypothetical protein